jgi:hypothetical protein
MDDPIKLVHLPADGGNIPKSNAWRRQRPVASGSGRPGTLEKRAGEVMEFKKWGLGGGPSAGS